MSRNSDKKIRLIALLEPINIRMSLCFSCESLVADIHNFIDDVMRKYSIKYKVGRVEQNGAWILPQYKIDDFLEDKSEITIYSIEFGLTLRTLAAEKDRLHVNYSIFDQNSINGKFIAKKTMRDNKNKKRIHTTKTTEVADNEDDQRSQTEIHDTDENAPNLAETSLLRIKTENNLSSSNKGKDTKSMSKPEPVQKNAPQSQSQSQSHNKNINKKKEEPKRQESEKKSSKHRHEDSEEESEGEGERRSNKKFSYDQNNDDEQEEIEDIPYKSSKSNQPPGKRVEQRK